MRENRRIQFSGQVQGVGFRYTAHRIAGQYEVGGFVRNLPDGRVELVVEGERAEIDRLLDELRTHFADNLTGESSQTHPSGNLPNVFEIRR